MARLLMLIIAGLIAWRVVKWMADGFSDSPGGGGGVIFRSVFKQGRMVESEGPMPGPIRNELIEVARIGRVSGTLRYYAPGEYRFSKEIDEGNRQRFRNVLSTTYKMPPTPG